MSQFVDLSGKRFGMLTVIKRANDRIQPSGQRKTMWECKCDCGRTVCVIGSNLKRGISSSCGCYGKQKRLEANGGKTHGLSNTRLYVIWTGMKQRCYNKNAPSYKWYGAKGVKVCNEWKSDFLCFYSWAMKSGYASGLTIDRIDGNGDYEPLNCRWATNEEQHNNQSNNVYLESDGEEKTIAQWAKEKGIKKSTLYMRLHHGWDVERALKKDGR